MANIPTRIDRSGLDIIKTFEGLKLEKYQDMVGIWTIGYGHVITQGENHLDRITPNEAENLLRNDIRRFEDGINKIVSVDINQNQFDALVSLAFNVGIGNITRSTLLKHLNEGNYDLAADEFLNWNKAGGREISGLARRRKIEKELFLKT